MAKKQKGINPKLEDAITQMLAAVMTDPHASITDKTKVIDRALKLEAIKLKTVPKVTDFDCLRSMIAAFETHCQKLDDYSLKWVSAFVAECEGLKSYPEAINHSLNRIQEQCPSNA